MGRIEDTSKYIFDSTITGDDYVIGTDINSANRTKSYKISDLMALAGVAAGQTKTFRAAFPFGSYTGNLLVYADGALVATLADTQEIAVDISKTLLFVPDGGTAPTISLQYQDTNPLVVYAGSPAITVPVKFSLAHYNNLEDSVTNGYAVVTVTDVI